MTCLVRRHPLSSSPSRVFPHSFPLPDSSIYCKTGKRVFQSRIYNCCVACSTPLLIPCEAVGLLRAEIEA